MHLTYIITYDTAFLNGHGFNSGDVIHAIEVLAGMISVYSLTRSVRGEPEKIYINLEYLRPFGDSETDYIEILESNMKLKDCGYQVGDVVPVIKVTSTSTVRIPNKKYPNSYTKNIHIDKPYFKFTLALSSGDVSCI
jgi:hypothetical protein